MNVVFISPHFPPQYLHFCRALQERGVKVLGLGDAPPESLPSELLPLLGEYFYVQDLGDYEAAHRALGYFVWRHGRVDRIESHNEHWLGLEARLREDFNVPGPRPHTLEQWRSKHGMAELFRLAGVPRPEGELVVTREQVMAFARQQGFPLVFKPDHGVGAARTFKVSNSAELEEALAQRLTGYIVQPFIEGRIVSFDGLVDAQGRIVFETAHAYSAGVMEVVNHQLDMSYWSLRRIPPSLRRLGEQTVSTFGIRERFFHVEFFERPDGSHVALEVNVRPPGGFTTDMMNYTAEVDVYGLWAAMLTGERLDEFRYEPGYHVAHVSRRRGRAYRASHGQVVAHLGSRLMVHREVPAVLAGAMGDEAYLIRDPQLEHIREDIAFIQALER